MTDADNEFIFACKCLNVRIRPQPPPAGSIAPISPSTPEYKNVFVGDEGITLSHPPLTLRTQSLGPPLEDASKCTRSVTLTCLMCQKTIYRVQQTIPIEVAGKDGARLPTDDWAEQEILKSASGWIDLHDECMTGKDVVDALNSPSYSKTFSVILPSPHTPSSSSEDNAYPIYITTSPSPPPPELPIQHLPTLKSIFAPAPFTPSHPVFVHLSSLAANGSQMLRTDAEAYIADVVKQKVAEIEKAEADLRNQVEAMWQGFKSGVTKIELQNAPSPLRNSNRRSSANWKDQLEAENAKAATPLVSVREFHPIGSPRRVALPKSKPRTSSLSASLATSTFHHPIARTEEARNGASTSPPTHSPNLSSPLSSNSYSSLSSRSSKSLAIRASSDGTYADGTYITPFKRNLDQGNDTATSFRYFTILEADTARKQQKAVGASGMANGEQKSHSGSAAADDQNRGGKKTETSKNAVPHASKTTDDEDISDANKQENDSRGKRKVTFDVKPDVVTIKREVKAEAKEEEKERAGRAAEEMIFDLEDEGNERPTAEVGLILNEPPMVPVRPTRSRAHAGPGLPSSLSTLRPASLPVPSAVRPTRHFTPTENPMHTKTSQSLKPTRDFVKRVTPPQPVDSDEDSSEVDTQEAEIMKLVAANAPSHRGAWNKNSKAWRTFVHRQGGTVSHDQGYIREEKEDDDTLAEDDESEADSGSFDAQKDWTRYAPHNVAASLPFEMKLPPAPQHKESLSLASYQPKSEHAKPAEEPTTESQRNMTSVAWRKATYAERDLTRAMDPGALDFAPEEDDDFDGDAAVVGSLGQGERGRLRALRIMQGGLSTPASGMWRSLA